MYKRKDKMNVNPSADKEFCAFVFVALSPEAYPNPERIAESLAKYREIENVDVVAGKMGISAENQNQRPRHVLRFLEENSVQRERRC